MLPLELKMILCTYDSELTFQLVKMYGARGAVEIWSMGIWCLVGVSADLFQQCFGVYLELLLQGQSRA